MNGFIPPLYRSVTSSPDKHQLIYRGRVQVLWQIKGSSSLAPWGTRGYHLNRVSLGESRIGLWAERKGILKGTKRCEYAQWGGGPPAGCGQSLQSGVGRRH